LAAVFLQEDFEMTSSLAETYRADKITISSFMRRRRFKLVNQLIEGVIAKHGICRLLDIGGSEYYWGLNKDFLDSIAGKIIITVTNIEHKEIRFENTSLFLYKQGDATTSDLYQGGYNLVHSNSVIEHVGDWGMIRKIADKIKEYDAPYYVQTPSFWFPYEPHFRTVGFQWLPLAVRARLLLKRTRGFRSAKTFDEAMAQVESVNLLDHGQMRELFPDAKILRERMGPLTKSYMAIRSGD
jgi:hypothetical protein